MLEDLVVFLQECAESVSFLLEVACGCADVILDSVTGCCLFVKISLLNLLTAITTSLAALLTTGSLCVTKVGQFFNLLGSSLILLANLVPRTGQLAVTAGDSVGPNGQWPADGNERRGTLSTLQATS